MSSAGQATVERMVAAYLVPRGHPSPDGVRQRLDRLLEGRVADTLRSALDEVLDPTDPSVWVIPRLDLVVDMDAGDRDEGALAGTWGAQIARGIADVVWGRRQADGVVRYRNRADYMAAVIACLAVPGPWPAGTEVILEGVESLPAGTAIREVLVRSPEMIGMILGRLAADELVESVVGTMSDLDASIVLGAWAAADADAGDSWHPVHAAPQEAAPWMRRTPDGSTGIATRAHLIERARSAAGTPAVPDAFATSDEEVARNVPDDPYGSRPETMPVPGAGSAYHAGAEGIVPELVERTDPVERQGEALLITVLKPAMSGRSIVSSEFASLFLLLPSLLEVGLAEGTDGSDDPRRNAALRAAVLARCLGGARAPLALGDPALHLSAGLDAPPSFDLLRAVSAEEAVVSHVAAMLTAGRAQARWLAAEIEAGSDGASAVLVIRDVESGTWLFARSLAVGDDAETVADALADGLGSVQRVAGHPARWIIAGPRLDASVPPGPWVGASSVLLRAEPATMGRTSVALAIEGPNGVPPVVFADCSLPWPPEASRALGTDLGRRHRCAEDLEFLRGRGMASLDPTWDLAATVIARAGLRAFASRLMGFGWSSASFLFENFLAGVGVISNEEDLVKVALPGSPLRMVLRMAGVDGQRYVIPWSRGRAVALSVPLD